MKAFSIVGLFLVLLVAAGFLAWTFTKPGFPVNRLIENAEGKQLDVVIQGKNGITLFVDRVADGERFEIMIPSLAWKDKLFAMRLPEQSPPEKNVEKGKPVDPYIASRLGRIEMLHEKKSGFLLEISSGNLSDILGRKRREDVLSIDAEIKELNAAITLYRTKTGGK